MRIQAVSPQALSLSDSAVSCLVAPVYQGEFPINTTLLQTEHEAVLQAVVVMLAAASAARTRAALALRSDAITLAPER